MQAALFITHGEEEDHPVCVLSVCVLRVAVRELIAFSFGGWVHLEWMNDWKVASLKREQRRNPVAC